MRLLRTQEYPIRDDEALRERLAIMYENTEGPIGSSPEANEAAFETRYSIVATAAIRDDWVPLLEWAAEIGRQVGGEVALKVIDGLRADIAKEKEWRDTLRNR